MHKIVHGAVYTNCCVALCVVIYLIFIQSHKHIVRKLQHFHKKHITPCNGTAYPIRQNFTGHVFWRGGGFFITHFPCFNQ